MPLRDQKGREIRAGVRVSVCERPSKSIPGYELPEFRGVVLEVVDDFFGECVVHIREFRTLHDRYAQPQFCAVQYGESVESRQYKLMYEQGEF